MKSSAAVFSAALLLSCHAFAEETEKPITMAEALRLGPEKLMDKVQGGEAGMDRACEMFAAAKRIETETKLAKRDLALVTELAGWRTLLDSTNDACCSLAYAMNGGGTLYAHAQARNDADLEIFLARFAGKLPLPEGKGSDEAMARLDKLTAFVKNLKPDKEICPEHMEEDFHNAQKDLLLKLTEVKNRIGSIPSKTAAEIAAQVVSEATWLDFPNDAKKD